MENFIVRIINIKKLKTIGFIESVKNNEIFFLVIEDLNLLDGLTI